jgi:hypothetical protein
VRPKRRIDNGNPEEKMDEKSKLEGQAEGTLVMHRRIK